MANKHIKSPLGQSFKGSTWEREFFQEALPRVEANSVRQQGDKKQKRV